MMGIKLDRYLFLGLFVLASVAANQWVNFVRWHDPLEILWFCDFMAVLLGAGMIFKNKTLITTTLVTAVPAQAVWIIDFFLELFGYGMGRTEQLWSYGSLVFWLSVNLHGILIPISLYGAWKIGFDKRALGPVVLCVVLLLTSTFLLTDPAENRNCVFYGCDQKDPGRGYFSYFIINSLVFWIIVMSANFYLFRHLFGMKNRHQLIPKPAENAANNQKI